MHFLFLDIIHDCEYELMQLLYALKVQPFLQQNYILAVEVVIYQIVKGSDATKKIRHRVSWVLAIINLLKDFIVGFKAQEAVEYGVHDVLFDQLSIQ